MSSQFLQVAQPEGLCLRYPDNIPLQREVTYESAVNMLLRATSMAQTVPFTWAFIDKPVEGTILLLFLLPNAPFPIDGIRFQDAEVKYTIPAGARELEVHEVKFGFVPGLQEPNASRIRRRYRLSKGGIPQLVVVHYTRGPATHIQPALMNQPVRAYPLRTVNEPPMFVSGEKSGQKVYPPGQGHGVPATGPMHPQQIGIGGVNFSQQQAMVAQQNSNLEALDRRRERERANERPTDRGGAPGRPTAQRMEEDDSGDEVDQISTRTLALTRYKRNHDWMNEVFLQASNGHKGQEPPKPAYSIFSKSDLEEKAAKLQADIELLQAEAAQRRSNKIREDQTVHAQADLTMNIGASLTV